MLPPCRGLACSPAKHPGKGPSATSLSFTFIFTFRSHFPAPRNSLFAGPAAKQPHLFAHNKRARLHCLCTADSPHLARVSAQLVPEDLPPTAGTVPVDVIAELSVRWLRDVTYLVGTAPSSRLKCSSLVPAASRAPRVKVSCRLPQSCTVCGLAVRHKNLQAAPSYTLAMGCLK